MKRTLFIALAISIAAAPAVADDAPSTPAVVKAGKMLVSADGARLASISNVTGDGAEIILDGRLVTVPTKTIALTNGKLTTSLTKAQVAALP